MAHFFRIKHKLKDVPKSEFQAGQWLQNNTFQHPDQTGAKTLLDAWEAEVQKLNIQYPNLDHEIEEWFGELSEI